MITGPTALTHWCFIADMFLYILLISSVGFFFNPEVSEKRESPHLPSSPSSSRCPPSSHPISHDLPVPRGRCCDKWDFPGFAPFTVISLYQAQRNRSEAHRRPSTICCFTRFHFVLAQEQYFLFSPNFFSYLFSHFF